MSSNRRLTVEKKFFKFEVYLMQKPRRGSGVCVTSPSLSRVRTFVFKHDVRVRSESEGGSGFDEADEVRTTGLPENTHI